MSFLFARIDCGKQSSVRWAQPRLGGEKRDTRVTAYALPGIIPAHAGKSQYEYAAGVIDGDHPRSCGEKCVSMTGVGCRTGTSPLMRGNGPCLGVTPSSIRIIPAHAGKRRSPKLQALLDEDHPRSCGEKSLPAPVVIFWRGSSPLMRGKVSVDELLGRFMGIIPAHAGKSPMPDPRIDLIGDHPRSCGEKIWRGVLCPRQQGSSPLMRGKGAAGRRRVGNVGIIPAHAGKRLKQVAKTGYFRETLHFSISIWYTKWVSLQSADTRCIPAVSN